MNSELLQQVRLIDPMSGTDQITDVLIVDGTLAAIGTVGERPATSEVRDCQGLILAPGLVDLYSHSGEPGAEERETLQSLMQAAAAGGFTRLAILPNTQPAIDNPATVSWFQAESRKSINLEPTACLPKLYCWGALTSATQGEQMVELAELATAGVVGFADGKPLKNPVLLRRLLEYLKPLDKPVALWCADPDLTGNGVMREGVESIQFGLPGIPAIAETSALSALLQWVEALGTPVHVMRVSTAGSVELIQAAKARGLPITASTTWLHLLFNSTAIANYDPSLRLDPPLGNPSDQVALRHAVKTGILDAIAVDHTPYTYEEKTVAFAEAPAGAIGLELALPLLWQNLVATGEWSAVELWRCLSTYPSACLKLTAPAIVAGQTTELVLFDPHAQWTVDAHTLKSLATNTPWLGQQIQGRVVKTWCA